MALRADDVNLGRDRALVELFQSGDCRAFEDLYKRYFHRIYRYCLRRVGDSHEAEEVAQEAFVRAYSAMPRLQGDRRFYPWLTVIASRLCVDTHRRRSRTMPTEHVELGVVDGGQDEIVSQVDRDLLEQALGRMTPRHREVLHLREHEGWSYTRIADHLGVQVGTVEALLFRARRALRREFHALAGPESRLAALPVIGWLVRRVFDARHRLLELAGQAAPLAAASAMSVAVVVGTVMAAGDGPHGPAQRATSGPAVQEILMPALAPTVLAPSTVAGTPTPGAAPADPSAWVKTTSGIGGTTYEGAKEQGANDAIQVEVAGVYVSVADPIEALKTAE